MRVTAEVLERPFVRFQEEADLFVRRAPVETATWEAQGEYEDMHGARAAAKLRARLTPINLTLLSGGVSKRVWVACAATSNARSGATKRVTTC